MKQAFLGDFKSPSTLSVRKVRNQMPHKQGETLCLRVGNFPMTQRSSFLISSGSILSNPCFLK